MSDGEVLLTSLGLLAGELVAGDTFRSAVQGKAERGITIAAIQ